jgi:bifunctional DNA-binding transcriptional regulator/antitoxin component of YhaV-PrlF toxin-antitoxin module
MKAVKLSSKNQVVIPRELCRIAKLKPGDTLIFDFIGGHLVGTRKPKKYTERLQSIPKDLWESIPLENYLDSERNSWNDPA